MHAVRDKKYKVYFGGSYRENWHGDGSMSVTYSERAFVEAKRVDGIWTTLAGDGDIIKALQTPDCHGLMKQYFEAALLVSEAVDRATRRGVALDALGDFFHESFNALVAPELMRVLMDEHGFSLDSAYAVCLRCCDDCRGIGIDASAVFAFQPRTSHLISILRKTAASMLVCEHIVVKDEYRMPIGAVASGTDVKLALRVLSGTARHVSLVLKDDSSRHEYAMHQEGNLFSVTFKTPDRGVALWYSFKIETEEGSQWLCADKSGFRGKLCGREEANFRLTVYLSSFDTPAWFRKARMYQIFPDRFAFSADDTAKKGIEYHQALGQTAELHASLEESPRHLPRPFEKDYIPDDFYGGTLKGIEDKLTYLKDLGIDCLYLNPIVEARSNHRYDASDYMRPDPVLGTVEDFEHLCETAQSMDMRIILDGVYSHTGADSVYFNRYGHYDSVGAFQSTESPYYPWFKFHSFPNEYDSWWGFTELPEVIETNAEYDRFIISGEDSVVKTWLKRGASGWRLDVADEIPDSVLARIREATKSVAPDAPIIGEVWDDAVIKYSYGAMRDYALGYSLDSVMNYPLRNAVLDFLHKRSDAYALRDFLMTQQLNYPKPLYYSLMNLLGSHDVERLRTNLASDINLKALSREEQLKLRFSQKSLKRASKLERLGAAILYSIPGVPSLYYGDEQGMCGVCDPFNRAPFMETGSDLHSLYKELIRGRARSNALSTGEAAFMALSSDVLVIVRYIDGGKDAFGAECKDEVVLTVINRSSEKHYFEADCSCASKGIVTGVIPACSFKMMKI